MTLEDLEDETVVHCAEANGAIKIAGRIHNHASIGILSITHEGVEHGLLQPLDVGVSLNTTPSL